MSCIDLDVSSSFETKRVNSTTFVIREDDAYGEHPLIFVKVHPKAPVIVLSDTGCDEPSEKHRNDKYIHLRRYIEQCPIKVNANEPLNPEGQRRYIIICTHCHYDHIGGITQFLEGGTTQIIASAAGRDFIESDLEGHSLYRYLDRPVPYYQVTTWAKAFERLQFPGDNKNANPDLGIVVIHTPGHVPDELAWYDQDEMHLYVGDSFYYEGEDGMPIIWPGEGNLIEWVFSMQKLHYFVTSENARAAAVQDGLEEDWVKVPKRVQISCAHQTVSVDAEQIIEEVEDFWWKVARGHIPVVKTQKWHGEVYKTWRARGKKRIQMSFQAPDRLMQDARDFFTGTLMANGRSSVHCST